MRRSWREGLEKVWPIAQDILPSRATVHVLLQVDGEEEGEEEEGSEEEEGEEGGAGVGSATGSGSGGWEWWVEAGRELRRALEWGWEWWQASATGPRNALALRKRGDECYCPF